MNNYHEIAKIYYREQQAEQMRRQAKQEEPVKIEPLNPPEPVAAPEAEPIKKQQKKNFFERVKQLVIKHLKKKR
jgi:hypothetical protein